MSSFSTQDLFTGEIKKIYEHFSEDQIKKSIESLYNAHLRWKKLDIKDRQNILHNIARRLMEKQDVFALLMTTEMGKTIKESGAEVTKCIKTIERACSDDLGFLDSREVHSAEIRSKIQHEPLGVIYSIMPWNFPLWQVIKMAIPALISGNTILLKHSEITPLMGQAIHDLFDNVFDAPILINNYISHKSTEYVLKHTEIGGVSLTGSVASGQAVYQIAAKYFKKVVLELGGSDPYIVFDDADLKLAAQKIAKGRLSNNGQACISVKRALIHKSVLDPFLALLKLEFDQFIIGDPKDPKTDLGPLAHRKFKESLADQIKKFINHTKAELIYSKPHKQKDESAYVDAEMYLLSKNSDWLKDQEFFGPVLVVIPFDTDGEAVQIANSTDFALGAGIFSQNLERAKKNAEAVVAGQIAINGLIASDLSLPFGGFKYSGLGRELGREAYFEFTQTKVVSCL